MFSCIRVNLLICRGSRDCEKASGEGGITTRGLFSVTDSNSPESRIDVRLVCRSCAIGRCRTCSFAWRNSSRRKKRERWRARTTDGTGGRANREKKEGGEEAREQYLLPF